VDSHYRVLRKTGRCANGYERDAGRAYHAVRAGRALCGTEPGRLSGWSDQSGDNVTCPRCLHKIVREATT
jgi:hypothetical protein